MESLVAKEMGIIRNSMQCTCNCPNPLCAKVLKLLHEWMKVQTNRKAVTPQLHPNWYIRGQESHYSDVTCAA